MKVLVLGAGGFLGSHVVTALLIRGHSVSALTRSQPRDPALLNHPGVVWHFGDYTDGAVLDRARADCPVIIHLASSSAPALSNQNPLRDLDEGVTATIRLLERVKTGSTRRIIFVSSGGTVYGSQQQMPISEDAPTNPICAYGVSRLAIEKYLLLYRHLYGLDAVILRVSNPFGEFQVNSRQQGVIAAFSRALLEGRPLTIWGNGTVIRDYVYAGDVAEALVLAAEATAPTETVLNIGSGVGRSLLEVLDGFRHLTGQIITPSFQPARTGDVAEVVLDIRRAVRVLDWCPKVSWHDALNRAWRWHGQNLMNNRGLG
ncbi:MAG: NAD-dependent epimerase/dehydratase family protein [Rhodospirillaceae bacterium]